MASFFGHAAVAATFGKIFPAKKPDIKIWILGIFCATIPDADVLAFKYGIPYDSPFGHRGFTHSILFALVLGILVTRFFYYNTKVMSRDGMLLFLYFFLCTASHGLLDAMTNGGLGVAFFFPFNNNRYFLPWRPIAVSPLHISSFFSQSGWEILKSEMFWIGIPCILFLAFYFTTSTLIKQSKK